MRGSKDNFINPIKVQCYRFTKYSQPLMPTKTHVRKLQVNKIEAGQIHPYQLQKTCAIRSSKFHNVTIWRLQGKLLPIIPIHTTYTSKDSLGQSKQRSNKFFEGGLPNGCNSTTSIQQQRESHSLTICFSHLSLDLACSYLCSIISITEKGLRKRVKTRKCGQFNPIS